MSEITPETISLDVAGDMRYEVLVNLARIIDANKKITQLMSTSVPYDTGVRILREELVAQYGRLGDNGAGADLIVDFIINNHLEQFGIGTISNPTLLRAMAIMYCLKQSLESTERGLIELYSIEAVKTYARFINNVLGKFDNMTRIGKPVEE